MKKVKILSIVLLTGMLVGCNNKSETGNNNVGKVKTEKVAKNMEAEVNIEKVTFINPIGAENEDSEYVSIEVKVKNISKEKMYVYDESFYLVEANDDEKITPVRLDYENGIETLSTDLSSDKSATGVIIFEVNPNTKYQLVFSSKNSNDIEMKLDLSKYQSSKEQLDKPTEALQAYIDVVFLQTDNPDYEKLVGNDSKTDIEMIKKEYTKQLKDMTYRYRATDEEIDKSFKSFIDKQSKVVELDLKQVGNVGSRARVEVNFKGISNTSVSDKARDAGDTYTEEHDDYDSEKEEQFVISKLPEIYSKADIGEPRRDILVDLKKKDDKWIIDYKSEDSYQNKQLLGAFLGDVD